MNNVFNINKSGTLIGKTLVKKIQRNNDHTGNISLTYEEFDLIFTGDDICYLSVQHAGCRPVHIEITNHMIHGAWHCPWRGCIIMPYVSVA